MIRVVAAQAIATCNITGPVLLRTERILDCPGCGHVADQVIGTLDDLFEAPCKQTSLLVSERFKSIDLNGDWTYLVPGYGPPGDLTVAALVQSMSGDVEVVAASRELTTVGVVTFVDALTLAIAESESPFDRGLVPLDPGLDVVVTNWYGDAVTALAGKRLARIVPDWEAAQVGADFELRLEPNNHDHSSPSLAALEQIASRLRRPDGCPWDREQTRESLYPMFVEELEELGEAIAKGDVAGQRDELGDVLFHLILQCQLAHEWGEFNLGDVIQDATEKMVRRHPHVFSGETIHSAEDVLAIWQRVKAEEKSING